jgi:hypothetical protein
MILGITSMCYRIMCNDNQIEMPAGACSVLDNNTVYLKPCGSSKTCQIGFDVSYCIPQVTSLLALLILAKSAHRPRIAFTGLVITATAEALLWARTARSAPSAPQGRTASRACAALRFQKAKRAARRTTTAQTQQGA